MCLNPNNTTTTTTTMNTNDLVLELAADDDAKRFKISIENDPSAVDEPGLWFCRRKGSNIMTLYRRTPLMVAATYGSLDVVRLILTRSDSDVNRSCGEDRSTALHCAASGGSVNAVEMITILLSSGADVSVVDADGNRPVDVIMVPPNSYDVKIVLEGLLGKRLDCLGGEPSLRVSTSSSSTSSLLLLLSPDEDHDSLSPSSNSTSSPMARKDGLERKEYPIDLSLPDIKNSIYATDEFRMFSFKVRTCSRAYSHDWTECPFVHPGENARRRDPSKYHYSCVPCPDFRKGACRRGDMCEYAHGVFECWLHPAQYRTRLCKDGTACDRRVCFFAHTMEELRPLYVSTGSAVPSPRSSASAMDMTAAMMGLLPGSPSSLSVMSQNLFTPPMSLSTNGMGSLGRQQPNLPTLQLPGSNNLQSSRLRSSLSARDMPVDDFTKLSNFDMQQLNEFCYRSSQARFGSMAENWMGRSNTINPSNLDELFSAEISSSPRYISDQGAIFSPSHKSALLNQFQQQQQQSLLSSFNTNSVFSPLAVDTQPIPGHNPLLHASLGILSPSRMSPRTIDAHSPLSIHISQLSQQEKIQQLRSLSSRDLGSPAAPVGSPGNSTWTKWGFPSGKPDWGVNNEELGRFKRSTTIDRGSVGEDPDVSWVQSLVNPTPEAKGNHGGNKVAAVSVGDGSNSNAQSEETVLGAWLEQMQLDQVVA